LHETRIRGHGDGDGELLGLGITRGALHGDHGGNRLDVFLGRVDAGRVRRWGNGGWMRCRSLLRVDGSGGRRWGWVRGGGGVEGSGVVGWWRWI